MTKYKLTYFNGRGLGEIIRLVLTAAGEPFEDVRLEHDDNFNKIKASLNLPFNQLPILQIDGKVTLCQSLSIARYLARKHNLAGKTDLESAQVDMIVDCLVDSLNPVSAFAWGEQDPTKKAELKKKYTEVQLPDFLTKIEALLVANKGGSGYFVGDSLTWADLYLVRAYGALQLMAGLQSPLDKSPKLKALYDKVVQLPKIAAYQAKLPVTPF